MPATPPPRLIGHCVEIGDDDAGQPRLVIHTTREEIMRLGRNLAFQDVAVALAEAPDNSPATEICG